MLYVYAMCDVFKATVTLNFLSWGLIEVSIICESQSGRCVKIEALEGCLYLTRNFSIKINQNWDLAAFK